MQRRLLRFLLLTAVLTIASTATATEDHPLEIGILGGLAFPDDDLVGHGSDVDNPGLALGAEAVYPFHRHWAAFADGLWSGLDTSRPWGDASLTTLRGGVRLFAPSLDERIQFLVNAGVGWMHVGLDDADSFDRPFLSFGFGQRFRATERVALHWELRRDGTFGDNDHDAIPRNLDNSAFLVGISFGLGGGKMPPDSDGDGVPDRRDACPDTPRGAVVDSRGCPLDSDRDGVWDGLDQCPNTPDGWPVDSKGCPLDTDGDGVADGADRCPGTPHGWPVNPSGCPLDSDGDGVPDGKDECPNTPAGAKVDDRGCSEVARVFQGATGGKLVLEGVNFEWNSDVLTAGARAILDRVGASLLAFPDVRVELSGHTDSQGTEEYNRDLSLRRAASARAYLVGRGVNESRMEIQGFGESAPVASNDTAEGRAKNRRVELKKID